MKLDITGSHYCLPEKDDDEEENKRLDAEHYLAFNKSKTLFKLGNNYVETRLKK